VGSSEDPAGDMDGRFLVGSGESESKWVVEWGRGSIVRIGNRSVRHYVI
jgi:hypothetical protein